jgi:hypothetical protein
MARRKLTDQERAARRAARAARKADIAAVLGVGPAARAASAEARTVHVHQRAVAPALPFVSTGLRAIKASTNGKIGKVVKVGRWAGMRIFTLTLEERKTCPSTCAHWSDCYGNHMLNATRLAAGPELVAAVRADLIKLATKYPKGFVVRLHILGDFYSAPYVAFWQTMLAAHPALHVYGYTHWHRGTAIGDALDVTRETFPDRFRVRWSDDFAATDDTALTNDDPRAVAMLASNRAFTCPEQTGRVASCGECGACWNGRKPVVFITH